MNTFVTCRLCQNLFFLSPLQPSELIVQVINQSGCVLSNVFQINHPSTVFLRFLQNLVHDLCANMQKTVGTDFRYSDFKILGEFLKILNLDLVTGTAAAVELSRQTSLF